MHIYKATLVIYVVAEHPVYAKLAADLADTDASEWEVSEVAHESDVEPAEWLDNIPWAETIDKQDAVVRDRTVRQLLAEQDRSFATRLAKKFEVAAAEAYAAGYKAYGSYEGLLLTDNPYNEGSPAADEWDAGYCAAVGDARHQLDGQHQEILDNGAL